MGKTVAFVPFRKGSKGIRNKNISSLKGIPLFKIVIDELLKVNENLLQKIIIATDYKKEDILPLLEEDPRLEFWNRLGQKSTDDTASTEDVIFEYLSMNNLLGYDNMLLVQITNPFIKTSHIESAIKEYRGLGTIFSVVDFNRYIWTEDRKILGSNNISRKRRQEMSNTYLENGSFYLFNISQLCITSQRINEPIQYFKMPLESIFEIDTVEDWDLIEKIL